MIAESGGQMFSHLDVRSSGVQHQQLCALPDEWELPEDPLALSPFGVTRALRNAAERPPEQRRRDQRDDDYHHQDDGEHLRGQDAQGQINQGDDNLHSTACVHARGDCKSLLPTQTPSSSSPTQMMGAAIWVFGTYLNV